MLRDKLASARTIALLITSLLYILLLHKPGKATGSCTAALWTSRRFLAQYHDTPYGKYLLSLGINDNILDSLKSMYAQHEACVMTQEGLTEVFRCTAGAEQGCPASPLLFGLYIDALEALLKEEAGDIDAPTLGSMLVAVLLFAEDIALFSYSPRGLQKQLDILCPWAFCRRRAQVWHDK